MSTALHCLQDGGAFFSIGVGSAGVTPGGGPGRLLGVVGATAMCGGGAPLRPSAYTDTPPSARAR